MIRDPSSLFLMSDLIFFHEEKKNGRGRQRGEKKRKEERVLIKHDRENANLNEEKRLFPSSNRLDLYIVRIYRKHLWIFFFFLFKSSLRRYFFVESYTFLYTFFHVSFEESNILFKYALENICILNVKYSNALFQVIFINCCFQKKFVLFSQFFATRNRACFDSN